MNEQRPEDNAASQQPPESQQQADDELAFPRLKPGIAWGESITKKRADELEAVLQKWKAEKEHGEQNGPFYYAELTGADVHWLVKQTLAGEGGEVEDVDAGSALSFGLTMWGLHTAGYITLAEIGLDNYNNLPGLRLEGAILNGAQLKGAVLAGAHLEGALLIGAHLERAVLTMAHLEGALLMEAHLEGAHLEQAHLEGTDMSLAFLDRATALSNVVLGNDKSGYVSLADVRWGEANMAVVDWTRKRRRFLGIRRRVVAIELGDERRAYRKLADFIFDKVLYRRVLEDSKHDVEPVGWFKEAVKETMQEASFENSLRRGLFTDAVRANRQLATALRSQGLNEDADRFAYKALKLQRKVLWRQGRWGAAFGSRLLDTIAGFGYRPLRAFTTYLFVVGVFAGVYSLLAYLGLTSEHFPSWDSSLVLSVTSFHGRVFFAGTLLLDDWAARVGAFEAVFGLLIEITFIATFTQRFFAR